MTDAGAAPEAAHDSDDAVATLARIEAELSAVEATLDRIDDGTWGRCSVCGTDIDGERLAADPLTPVCAEHADLVEST